MTVPNFIRQKLRDLENIFHILGIKEPLDRETQSLVDVKDFVNKTIVVDWLQSYIEEFLSQPELSLAHFSPVSDLSAMSTVIFQRQSEDIYLHKIENLILTIELSLNKESNWIDDVKLLATVASFDTNKSSRKYILIPMEFIPCSLWTFFLKSQTTTKKYTELLHENVV